MQTESLPAFGKNPISFMIDRSLLIGIPSFKNHMGSKKHLSVRRKLVDSVILLSMKEITRNQFNQIANAAMRTTNLSLSNQYTRYDLRDMLNSILLSRYLLLTYRYFLYQMLLEADKLVQIYGQSVWVYNTTSNKILFNTMVKSCNKYHVLRADAISAFSLICRNSKNLSSLITKLLEYPDGTFSYKSIHRIVKDYSLVHPPVYSFIKSYTRKKMSFITKFYSGVTISDLQNDLMIRALKVYYNLQPCTLPTPHLIGYLCSSVKTFTINIIESYVTKKRSVLMAKEHKDDKNHLVCVSDSMPMIGRGSENTGENRFSDNTISDIEIYQQTESGTLFGLTPSDYATMELERIIKRYKKDSFDALSDLLTLDNRHESMCKPPVVLLVTKKADMAYDKACIVDISLSYNQPFSEYLRCKNLIDADETNMDLIYKYGVKKILTLAAEYLEVKTSMAVHIMSEISDLSAA